MHADQHKTHPNNEPIQYEFWARLVRSDFWFWSSFSSLAQESSKIALEYVEKKYNTTSIN